MMTLPEQYDAKAEEAQWQKYWKDHEVYKFKDEEPVFSIDTPPPTVSGQMHMGHAFSYTQGDFIGRFKRMRGYNVFYPFGTDDNGLPTEKLVEKLKNVSSPRMDRKEFRTLCYLTVKELLPEFTKAWKDIAMSADFDQAYSTIDERSQRISQLSFLSLYSKGYVFRREDPFAWCVHCRTAIAQAEFDNVEQQSAFNEITFGVENASGAHSAVNTKITIATTRPELLPACVALVYNPEDKRYHHLAGKYAVVPLFNYAVPIIADKDVLMDKGTGLMMVCTFGDKEDIEKWRRHKLPLRAVIQSDGKLTELAGEYAGLTIKDARKAIIAKLHETGHLLSSKPITHAVNVHERCGTEVEFLKTTQWFVNVLDHKEELLKAGRSINWYPEHMRVRYEHWVENLQWDWAISRQRHYGVPFPVWFSKRAGEEGKVLLADVSQLPVDPLSDVPVGYTRDEVDPELDVMDTWATSSVSPQLALGWDTKLVKEHFPMTLRLQAHDIIRTWAFYTIVKAQYSFGTVPWKDIVISGHALDSHGKKMSKSKGNTIDPIAIMAQHSTDALRWWAASSKLGDDLWWQEKDLTTGKRTINKLWNAGKFTIQNLSDYDPQNSEEAELELLDRWMLAKLRMTIEQCTESFERYEYSKARAAVDQFFWSVYCDLYLELVKGRIYNTEVRSEAGKTAAQHALSSAMLSVLKLFAPFMPYVTETVYQSYWKTHDGAVSIHVSSWPDAHEDWRDDAAESAGDIIIQILSGVRKFRSEKKLGMKSPLNQLTIRCSSEIRKSVEPALPDLQAAANVASIQWSEASELSWELEQ